MMGRSAGMALAAALMMGAGWAQAADLSAGAWERWVAQKKLSPEQAARLKAALARAPRATQGVASSRRGMSREQCEQTALPQLKGGESDIAACGRPWMAPVPSADGKTTVCVDRFEYPGVPCEYPLTWVQANEAAMICEAEGKRLCDASEWEASCAETPRPPDYAQERGAHNASRKKTWAYGDERRGGVCGMGQAKTAACQSAIESNRGVKEACGSHDWPTGAHPECSTPAGVYDQHGNVAEHMNLARSPKERGSAGGHGVTEMKGSWFAFSRSDKASVHEDDCLWRAPGWHRTETLSPKSHANYHLGFRCCADVAPASAPRGAPSWRQ